MTFLLKIQAFITNTLAYHFNLTENILYFLKDWVSILRTPVRELMVGLLKLWLILLSLLRKSS